MFKHHVIIQLKADSFTLLSRKIESSIMPLLRLQKGFHHGITFVAPERSSATEDTFWNTREDAESYQKTAYPEVLKIISEVVSSAPQSSISEVAG